MYSLARSTGHKVVNMKDQRKCMVYFEDKGMEDFGGFRKVPSQNTQGVIGLIVTK